MYDCGRITAYIDLDAVVFNIESMRANLSAGVKMAAVIKADGYGHGAVEIAKTIEQKDYIWGFAVATAGEALELKAHGIEKPILILGAVFPKDFEALIKNEIRLAVFDTATLEELSRKAKELSRKAYVHLKVDTGMSRIGFKDDEKSADEIVKAAGLEDLCMEGLFTHFARADETDKSFTERQLERYLAFEKMLESKGLTVPLHHVSNSAGIIDLPEANLDMVRAGVSIYGLYPSEEVDKTAVPLKPVMSLKSRTVYVKEVEPGTQISYGGTYTADKRRRIATIPVGYADGYPRQLSNKGFVLINGMRAPIRGRVCMDQFMVDVTDIPDVGIGTEVTLLGSDGTGAIRVEELSGLCGRFNYEFVCDISQRVPRIYLKDAVAVGAREGTR